MRLLIPIFIFVAVVNSPVLGQSEFQTKRWSRVYKYELKELPKSALAVVDTLYTIAKREKNIPQVVKALLYQSKFALTLQEDAELVVTQKLKKEIAQSDAPLKNILESVLAELYWQYFKENRSKFYQRSRTETTVNKTDFRTWDSNAMFREIHNHYQNSLLDKKMLQGISLANIDDILAQAENSKLYRPTLYDFLAQNALAFYAAGESGISNFKADFKLTDPSYFETFENIRVLAADSLSPRIEVLKLFRELLSFHSTDKKADAYVGLELDRLQFLVDEGDFVNPVELQKKALLNLSLKYQNEAASALADFNLASILNEEGVEFKPGSGIDNQFKKKDALEICNWVIAKFPESDGANKCSNLKEHILFQKLGLRAEKYVPVNTHSRIYVNYTNIDTLSFSAFKVSEDFDKRFNESMNDSIKLVELSRLIPESIWGTKLKTIQDYREHTTEVIVPPLKGGRYILLGRVSQIDLAPPDVIFGYATVQITDLALLERSMTNAKRFQVVNRNTGRPLHGADVYITTERDSTQLNQHLITNKDGFIEVASKSYGANINATVTFQNDRARFGDYYLYELYEQNTGENVRITAKSFLFTDRSIYRPGQTVFFKGILIKIKAKKTSIVTNEYVEVTLEDVNGDEVGLQRLKTNSFGSFSGEFKLPASGLTGEYTLYVNEDSEEESKFYEKLDYFDDSELEISVEEYKRPTFETTFLPVKETYKINDTVSVKGSALSFSGAKISGGKVVYHVSREVHHPAWYFWTSRRNYYDEPEEITSGEGSTNTEGEFQIKFKAIPDENSPKEQQPIFYYEITADVTDVNGETRSATTTVKVGYHSLLATISAPAIINRKIQKNNATLTVENLNGQPVLSRGVVSIYKLKSPPVLVRPRPWPKPDLPVISEDDFKKLFPHDIYEDTSNPPKWEKEKLMTEIPFDTKLSSQFEFSVDKSWELGSYLMELSTTDSQGLPIIDLHRFTVIDPTSKAVPDNQMLIFELDKMSYRVGDVVKLKIGSASKDITITIDIEKNQKIFKTSLEHLSANVKVLSIPVTADMAEAGGFAVRYGGVNYNAFHQGSKVIPVVSEVETMEIETLTFKDKLQPGAKETWSFQIKGNNPLMKEAEVLTSMYDASLDQFKPHEWVFNPLSYNQYYSHYGTSGDGSFGEERFTIRNQNLFYYQNPRTYFDQFDWFGFGFSNKRYLKEQYLQRLYSAGFDTESHSRVNQSNNKNLRKGLISGHITSSDGSPLPGVNVVIKGTQIGTVTDENGNYFIEADKGDQLVFSFIGFSTADARIGRKNILNVMMEEDITKLEEVVVVGYGTQMRRSMTGSVTSVSLAMSDSSSLAFAFTTLGGAAAGVQVTGMPGGAARLVIRGSSSIDSGSEPLYIVDGVPVESYKLDQEDIATIQVLKGQAATSLYGSRAANGVIIITTKSGQKKLDEEMAKVSVRKNFNETAFFFPHLTTDEEGRVRFNFTTPESLTRWKLQLLAHNRDLVSATKILQAVTQKDLMVTPNAPRFLRVDDEIVFSVKITNLTLEDKEGNAALQLTNAITGEPVDPIFKNLIRNQHFKVKAKGSTQVSWKLKVPAGIDAVQYKVAAKAGNFSDGEQNALPVLSNRTLVTETLPMYIRSGETKTFSLEKLKTVSSTTLKHHQLTLEVTSNPAWYAIKSLPYLMEFPHECAEQIFSRYYSNLLASHIAKSNPSIRQVFDKWASSGKLIGNLEQNEELKSLIIQETPWLRDAQSESEQQKRIATLFDAYTTENQLKAALGKLQEMQLSNGGFTWFSGGRYASRYITLHIASSFGHLKKLNIVNPDKQPVEILNKAIGFLDDQIVNDFNKLLIEANSVRTQAKNDQDGRRLADEYMERRHLNDEQVHYLYMRSFFPEVGLTDKTTPAVEYFQKQCVKYWGEFNLYLKGMIALVQYRKNNNALATDIMKSLRETSIQTDEMGMYWKENKAGWYWNEAPIETQSLLIEAFSEVEAASISEKEKIQIVDELKIWLLKNKQTSQWKTTKATTEAIYALLLNGTQWLPIDNQLTANVGNKKIAFGSPQTPEAGTGYFKTSWKGDAVTPSLSEVKLTKNEAGVAWAGLYWQYFEDLDKITPAETPLKLTKKVFQVMRNSDGEILKEVNPNVPVQLGTLLRVRIELAVDRPMDFLHMKDMRASGLEPVDVLSEYKWQDGLGYYQSTKDAATNFFFDSVQRGMYVFEYDLRTNNKGDFSNGITTIQSMYAPEFSSHSEGIRIRIE